MNKTLRIAAIPGDGIGKEVLPEGVRVLQAAAERWGLALSFEHFEWASCDYYAQHGAMMPDDWRAQLQTFDAIYFGAVGWPDIVPDHISLWGSLLKFRREFDQYVNLRPVRLFPGVPCPLAGKQPGDIDFYVVRENTEGEYSALGGHVNPGTEHEVVIQESVFTRRGVDRILRYAFELAQSRPRKTLTSATKSNGLAISMPFWDQRVEAMAQHYPVVKWDKQHIDILCARFVLQPERLTWWSAPICSAISSPISARPVPAPSALPRRQTSIRIAPFRRCLKRYTVRRRISTAKISPTRLPPSGPAR